MLCTMLMLIASCVFHGSWPVRPASTNASASAASAAAEGGSWRRGSMPPGLLGLLGVAALELLDAARGIDDLLLAGVVRMRFRRDLDLDDRILLAVLPLHGFAALGVDRRARQDALVDAGVEEDHGPVLGVGTWFHRCLPCEKGRIIKGNSPLYSRPARLSSRYLLTSDMASRSGSTSRQVTPAAAMRRNTRSRCAR